MSVRFDTAIQKLPYYRVVRNSECFQIHQKRLRWVSLYFRGLFGQFGVTLKTIYLFECLRGTLVVRKVLACFFFSSETGSYSRGHLAFIVFYCIYTESFRRSFFFLNNNHNILILKCENTTFENRS